MRDIGLFLVVGGIIAAIAGGCILLFGGIPGLGKLPGDIRVEGRNSSFYFPITTCIVISIILTIVFSLIGRFR